MKSGFALHGLTVLGLLLVGLVPTAEPATYRVGPGRTYSRLQDVAPLLNPGDVVEVDGNATYPGDATFRRPGTAARPITLRGMRVSGKRPVISGGTNTVHFRTDDIGSGADHYVMEGFEIKGGSNRCVFHQSNDLTLRDVAVHDCPSQGILGADWGSGSLTIEHSEVYRCGGGTYDHQIYIGIDEDNYPGGVFRMQYSWVHDGNGGNNVKSRAARNEIYYNRIEGAYYHEIELIGAECCDEGVVREDSDVVGNLIVKKGSNADFFVARFGGDGTAQTWGRYRFVNNTVVVSGTSAVFRLFDGLESVEMHNNVFYRSGGPVTILRTAEAAWKSGVRIAGSNNWVSNGSSVPSQWMRTLTGSSPGFANASGGDYSPAAGSLLVDAGNEAPSSPLGSPFPDPLFPPAFQPRRTPGVPAAPNPRPFDGQLDVGAYEQGSGSPPSLSVADVFVAEGNSGTTSAVFAVTLSPAAAGTVTVRYATANGTATAGSDYTAASGSLTFAAGQTAKAVRVAVVGDAVAESHETFYLALSGATRATIADSQATGTIRNDDVPAVRLSIGDVSVSEGNRGTTNATFTVRLSAVSSHAVTVGYATANGTATAGSDFVAQSGSLRFSAGQTSKTIVVAVRGDAAVEPNETFFVNLGNPAGAILADAQGRGTITTDDGGTRPTVIGDVSVTEATSAWGRLGSR